MAENGIGSAFAGLLEDPDIRKGQGYPPGTVRRKAPRKSEGVPPTTVSLVSLDPDLCKGLRVVRGGCGAVVISTRDDEAILRHLATGR